MQMRAAGQQGNVVQYAMRPLSHSKKQKRGGSACQTKGTLAEEVNCEYPQHCVDSVEYVTTQLR